MMTEPLEIYGGVDTHAETIHVAAIDDRGQPQADHEYPTTPAGYRKAIAFLHSRGRVRVVGVEGTSSYGAGITRALSAEGLTVAEAIRPDRADRRRHGKSVPLRLLKRAIAREMFTLLTKPVQAPEYADLRTTRQSKNITLTAVARDFSVWPTVISRIERGLQRDDAFVDTYREWLAAA
ncbi:IS110 family transposase [Tomitella cavernea]|uniref:Transposase IS110-like N-terminal domain-containing protein n=1 Tax=Tomitella cavernea TaxID=1387982 RepID=A0ABP9CJ12_9ACTN|nr:IS110 family transposase [Tomitella cavernea]